jgi:hypothetical protein
MSYQCPICLEVMGEVNHAVTNCGHHFHLMCLMMCCTTQNSCPICRGSIMTNQPENDNNDVMDTVDDYASVVFPEEPRRYDQTHEINGRILYSIGGYLYFTHECNESDRVGWIRLNDDGTTSYIWYRGFEFLNVSEDETFQLHTREIPQINIINGSQFYIKDGYMYLNIECEDYELVARIIHENDDGTYQYEWYNHGIRKMLFGITDDEPEELFDDEELFNNEESEYAQEQNDYAMVDLLETITYTPIPNRII